MLREISPPIASYLLTDGSCLHQFAAILCKIIVGAGACQDPCSLGPTISLDLRSAWTFDQLARSLNGRKCNPVPIHTTFPSCAEAGSNPSASEIKVGNPHLPSKLRRSGGFPTNPPEGRSIALRCRLLVIVSE